MRGKQKTNEEFQNTLREKCPGIHTDDTYVNAFTKITFYCDKGHSWLSTPTNVLDMNARCPYCSGQKPIVGETDLWTTRPDIAQLLVNKEDGYMYKEYSHKQLNFKCPNCGIEFKQDLNHVSRRGISCPNCSDGISYPNRFMRNILFQLNVDFISEYSPEWISPKRYDFYFEIDNNKYIVEMDGGIGHGHDPIGSIWFDKNQSIAVDEYKDMMALQHDIEVIRIDCNYNADVVTKHMYDNILNSKLGQIFDFTFVDIKKCEYNAQKSIFYDICDMWNKSICSKEDIAHNLKISISYVKKAINKGKRLGIIIENKTNYSNRTKVKDDPIICIETNEKFINPNEVLKQLGIKIYDVIDKPNRSAGKLQDGRRRHWARLNKYDATFFIENYYSNNNTK